MLEYQRVSCNLGTNATFLKRFEILLGVPSKVADMVDW